MSWKEAHEAWDIFLCQVEDARRSLHCSYSNAWFRGHSDSDKYRLQPSLFRLSYTDDPEFKADIQKCLCNIQKNEKEVQEYLKKWKQTLQNKKSSLSEIYTAYQKNDNLYLKKANEDYDIICQQLVTIKDKIIKLQKKIELDKEKIKHLRLLYMGEREAFIEYSFRSGRDYRSSWETLAEMQHHGVPTRLLDWSEVLAIALYFALTKYYKELNKIWLENRSNNNSSTHSALPFHIPKIDSTPSIWVLNPYKASEQVTGRLRVWDLTLEKDFDYFENFIVKKSWHFDKPIPMYSPWRNTRIAAQQGMFTVFGYGKEPLDVQFSKGIVREIKISPMAAVYGVKFLKEVLGIDHFMLFRDLDTLAAKVKKEFLERK